MSGRSDWTRNILELDAVTESQTRDRLAGGDVLRTAPGYFMLKDTLPCGL
jgi:hypothetical protein